MNTKLGHAKRETWRICSTPRGEKHPGSLECIVEHFGRSDGERAAQLMDGFLPSGGAPVARPNNFPLGREHWAAP